MTTLATRRARARRALDRRHPELAAARNAVARPSGGWIRAVREALGMSVTDLATRMNVVPSTVHRIETSEREDHIQLATLRRAAEALNCDLVYALVPRQKLEDTVDARARELALLELAELGHTMGLEAQGLGAEEMQERLPALAEDLKSRPGLWRS